MSLKIKNLSKSFDGKTILRDFSFDFADRGIYLVKGESGIGKTTLLCIISGLDQDYIGDVLGGGINNVSFAFQEYRLFPTLTAIENLIFAISDTKDEAVVSKAQSLLTKLNFAKDEFHLLPDQMSGGMKQRISIARALMKDCPILLLDEPTKELDRNNISAVHSLILSEGENRLVIIVSHSEVDAATLPATEIML